MPSSWNRSKATALAITLALHLLAGAWLLAVRFVLPDAPAPVRELLWLPMPDQPPPPPAPEPPDLPAPPAPPTVLPLPRPPPEIALAPRAEDWERTAREVAGTIGQPSGRRVFGEMPEAPAGRPREEHPPSIWEPELGRGGPRLGEGRVDTTPEGETILWVSDKCYIPLSSTSLTMQHIHKARQGIRRCVIPLGKDKPRDDLFEHLERPPPPQEPGCGTDGIGLSCAR